MKNKNNTIRLTLKKRWFDLILSGEKKEEYRELKPYWVRRLLGNWHHFRSLNDFYRSDHIMPPGIKYIEFVNGYRKDSLRFVIEWKGLRVGTPNPEWCPEETDLEKNVFCLSLGEIITNPFVDQEKIWENAIDATTRLKETFKKLGE